MTGQADLRKVAGRLLDRCLAWLRAHLHRCVPVAGDRETDAPTHKRLGELAVLARIVLRTDTGHEDTALLLLDHVWRQYRHGDALHERQLRHPTATDPLEVYAPLRATGRRHMPLERLLAHLHGRVAVRAVELVPNRRLSVLAAARATGLPGTDDTLAVVNATWLGRRPEPWLLDWEHAYAMTHTVFHVTDWGSRPGALPGHLQDYLGLWLPVWHDVWQESGDWDLVGELLATDRCLSVPGLPLEAWRRLASQQRPDGLVPRDTGGAPKDTDQFDRHFHSTAVAALAAALALSRPRTASGPPVAPRGDRGTDPADRTGDRHPPARTDTPGNGPRT
jgi:hypothetical protein